MDKERPSVTAEGAAAMRALHQLVDDEPKILDDPVAVRLVDTQGAFFRSRVELLEHLPPSTRLHFKAAFVMRSRYAEDCLAEAFGQGVRQYVVLGAGLDTFAYRQLSWANSLRIFEVDHPTTQQWKRRRLAEANIAVPRNVSFVSVDFDKVAVPIALSEAGLDFAASIFFSLLGVTQYLTETALDQTFRLILSAPSRSEIVFSFVTPDAILPTDDATVAREFTARFAAIGEPWLSRFLPDQLTSKLIGMGFSKVFYLTPEEANRRYFQNRRDGLNASILEQMIKATV
jgi:methyltransferase (TIGR00027 family)